MAILAFQKPDKVVMLELDVFFGRFEFRPLEPGYGITIGNALRRILLSSLEGFAITSMKIEGVEHEFSTIKGVVDDVTDMILNLKQIRFKRQIDSVSNEKVIVKIAGQDVFTAGDINKFMSGFQVLNPELVICHMDPTVKMSVELNIDKGRGYVPAEDNIVWLAHRPCRKQVFRAEGYAFPSLCMQTKLFACGREPTLLAGSRSRPQRPLAVEPESQRGQSAGDHGRRL